LLLLPLLLFELDCSLWSMLVRLPTIVDEPEESLSFDDCWCCLLAAGKKILITLFELMVVDESPSSPAFDWLLDN
jgi:hypothetical protein